MPALEIDDLVRFGNYTHKIACVPEVFGSNDAVVVIDSEPDGVLRCALADFDGRPILAITDTLFVEELGEKLERRQLVEMQFAP